MKFKFAKPSKKLIIAAATALTLGTAAVGAYAAAPVYNKYTALTQSKISASQAIDRALEKVGGQAVGVDFNHKHGQSYYEVEVVSGEEKFEVYVDAATGSILDSRPDYDSKPRRPVPAAGVSLKQAISAAEAKTGGRAKDAEFKYKSGLPVYKVETVNGVRKYEVRVNPANGQVTSSHLDF